MKSKITEKRLSQEEIDQLKKNISQERELMISFTSQDFVIGYLNNAMALSTSNEDMSYFILALRKILISRFGNMTNVSKVTSTSRPQLYKTLSKNGNPTMAVARRLLNALGLQFGVQKKESA